MKRALAVITLTLVAAFGLLLGPRYGEGTDDRAARLIAEPSGSRLPTAFTAWIPQSDAQEQRRFAMLGGGALLVLLIIFARWPKDASARTSTRP